MLKSILLHLDGSARSLERLELAAALAARHEARLTTLYAVPSIFDSNLLASASSPEAAAVLQAADRNRRKACRADFDRLAATLTPRPAWNETALDPAQSVTLQGQCVDLLVLGQHEERAAQPSFLAARFVETVLAGCGRPALLIPYVGAPKTWGGRILVAWKNTPEAARAVSASLPFLTRADRVDVIEWNEGDGPGASGPLDIQSFLDAHGVKVRLHRHSSQPEQIGEALLSLAADLSCDLLVMGCYGHSRAREWVLGGATRTILRSMTVPVLMMH